jgi:hypothetical protein
MHISPSSASTESESNEPVKNKPKLMCRQHNGNYLSFRLFWCGDATCPITGCLVCGERLSNDAMAPSKLKRHFITKHPSPACKDTTYFRRSMQQNKKQAKFMTLSARTSEKIQEANYMVDLL